MTQGFWRLENGSAFLSCGALEARVDLARPDLGLSDVKILDRPLNGARLLCVEAPDTAQLNAAAIDVYQRGADLVATYAASDAWPFRLQVYWRVWIGQFAPAIAAVELIVSLQTQLLDTVPRLFASSQFPPADVYQLVDASRGNFVRREPIATSMSNVASACDCTLFRPLSLAWTCGEMTHPQGAVMSELVPERVDAEVAAPHSAEDVGLRLSHQLFAERLEKGVILRARVLTAFVERSDERRSLASIYRDYAASDPPLTT
jgi:hypothetical protein